MKTIKFLAVLLIIIFLSSCSDSSGPGTDIETGPGTTYAGNQLTYEFSDAEYFAVNMYLSGFSEIGLLKTKGYDSDKSTEADMLEIGLLYCILNYKSGIESGDYRLPSVPGFPDRRSAYRVTAEELLGIIDGLLKKQPIPKNIEGLYYDENFNGEPYFYWPQREIKPGGFALLTKIEQMGNNRYAVSFNLYNTRGMSQEAADKKYYGYTKEEALREFPRGTITGLSAIIEAEDLSRADTMKLISLPRVSSEMS